MSRITALNFDEPLKKLLSRYEQTDKTCPKHNTKIFKNPNGDEVCFSCVKESITEQEKEIAEQTRVSELKGYFKRHSIIPDSELKQASFKNYQAESSKQKEVLGKARNLTKLYIAGHVFNTVLTGSAGAGKSHLAMAMIKNINETGKAKRCLFVNVSSLVQLIRNTYGNSYAEYSEYDYIQMMSKPEFLVIDDLGSEVGRIGSRMQASDFISRVLYEIMNSRQDKATIITTNLSSNEIAKMYDSKLISRMYRGIAKYESVISMHGMDDYRVKGVRF